MRPDGASNPTQLGQIWGSYNEGAHVALDPRSSAWGISFDGKSGVSGKYATGQYGEFSAFATNHSGPSYVDGETFILATELAEPRLVTSQDIGYLVSAAHYYSGYIYELIVWNSTLTPSELESQRSRLAQKWFNTSTSASAPVSPIEVQAEGAQGAILLSWNRLSNRQSQVVYKSGTTPPSNCDDGNLISSSTIGDADHYVVTGLDDSTTYSFVVCGVDELYFPGVSEASQAVSATTLAPGTSYPLSGLVLHLDASFGVVHTDGVITSWSDKVSGTVFTPEINDSDILLTETGMNGAPAVTLHQSSLNSSSPLTFKSVIVVYNVSSANQNDNQLGQIFGHYSDGSPTCHVATDTRSSRYNYSFDGAGSSAAFYSNDLSSLSPSAVGTSANGQFSEDTASVVYAQFESNCTINSHQIGRLDVSSTHYFSGMISEILVYDRDLTSEELTNLKTYITSKYSITFP